MLARTAPFLRPHRSKLVLSLVLAMVVAALGAGEPLVMKRLFDELAGGRSGVRLTCALVSLGAFFAARGLLAARLDMAVWRARIAVHFEVSRATIGHLHELPVSYHARETVGGLMTKIDRGINGAIAAFAEVAFNVLPAAFYVAIAVVVMWGLDHGLAIAILAFVPFPPAIGAHAAGEQSRRERSLMTRWTALFARLNEVLSGMTVVKSFAMELVEKERFLAGVQEANALVLDGVARDARSTTARGAATGLARLVALSVGAVEVVRGTMTLGTLVAFMAYVGGVFGPVQGITSIYQTFRKGLVALEMVFSILDAPESAAVLVASMSTPSASIARPIQGDVEFRDIMFAYRGGVPVLDRLSFRASPGQSTALVGASGSGKTTAMHLLLRLHDPASGRICIDGVDVSRLCARSIRRHIGVVPQDGALFNDTVRANIAFGTPGATDAEIDRAARAAHAHEFIERLPRGYATVLGERGGGLSAGQRQRIAIARALLKDAPILILDEATSALDVESEARVQSALDRLMQGRTTLTVAHRLSTVLKANRILVFGGGRVVEDGNHHELLARDGQYAKLVRTQFRGTGPAGTLG
jgi:ATP-binding cassette subfamily B protein